MANTYTQLHIHFVFAVKYRMAVIQSAWEERLHKYITGIVQNNGHKMLVINSASDHVHFFAGLNPKQSISNLLQLVKVIVLNLLIFTNLLPENFSGKVAMEPSATVMRRLMR